MQHEALLRHNPIHAWSDVTSSSSEGDSPKQQPVNFNKRYLKTMTSSSSLISRDACLSSYYVTYDRRLLSRGAVELAITAEEGTISVSILQVKDIPIDFIQRASLLLKLSLNTDKRKKLQFRTRSVPVTSSKISFNETLAFSINGGTRNRLVIGACLKHDRPLFPEHLGWMSFGLNNFLQRGKEIRGWYNLLDRNSGRRKHMQAKEVPYIGSFIRSSRSRSSMKIQRSRSYLPPLEIDASGKRARESVNLDDSAQADILWRNDQESYVYAVESRNRCKKAKRAKLVGEINIHPRDELHPIDFDSKQTSRYGEQTKINGDYHEPVDTSQISERNRSSNFTRATTGSFRYLQKRARRLSRRRSVLVEKQPSKPSLPQHFSDTDLRRENMLSLSTPPACVLHAAGGINDTSDSWIVLSPRCEPSNQRSFSHQNLGDTCHSLPAQGKKQNSFLGLILEPLKGAKRNDAKNAYEEPKATKPKLENFEPSPFVRKTKNSRKAIKQLGEIFHSREGHGSTRSLYTGPVDVKSSNSFFRNGFRLSKRKKTDSLGIATPMVSRRRKGRFSIGDPTTPTKGKGNLSIFRPTQSEIDDVNVFIDGPEFFKAEDDMKSKSKSRRSLKTWLSKKSDLSLKTLAETKDVPFHNNCKATFTLVQVLHCKEAVSKFMKFLKAEFSDENLEFLLEVEVYKQHRKHEKLCVKICDKYIVIGAPREVNITSCIRDRIIRQLPCPVKSTFNEAENHIFNLLERDSFKRFLRSPTGQSLLNVLNK
nr:uncharacterized protein LOC100186664 [Ciona intestinalis]|eukprot:XP_002121595.3 uncharacterized protein LOC100186664 [Ciona intestinalis]